MVIMMSESIVGRYLKYATTVMVKNNDTGIKCPCRTCKLGTLLDPFSGTLQEHLLRKGFMETGVRWTYERTVVRTHYIVSKMHHRSLNYSGGVSLVPYL